MADDQVSQTDSSDSSNTGMNLSFDQIMKLIKETSANQVSPSSVYQNVQPTQQKPLPQTPYVPANVPQQGKVLDQASGAYVRPETAERLAYTRGVGNQFQQQDQQKAQQDSSQPKNTWQQIYESLRQQNPQASPQQLLSSMKAYKDAGAFEIYGKNVVGKTVEEQVYNSLIQSGLSAKDAAEQVQKLRGISPEAAGEKAAAVETGKKQADVQINKPKAEEKLDDMTNGMDNTLRFIDMAKKQSNDMTTGFIGSTLANIKGTPQYDLAQTISTVKSNIGFDKLQSMKDESPTGSALGRVTNMEINLLQNVVANLEQGQSKDQFNLHLDIAKEEIEKAKKRIADAYDLTYGSGGAQAAEKALGKTESNISSQSQITQPKTVNWSDLK